MKLSALVALRTARPFLERIAATALDAFGPQRTMFGSDWPVCLASRSHHEVVTLAAELIAGLDQADQAMVWSGTAEAAYRLPDIAAECRPARCASIDQRSGATATDTRRSDSVLDARYADPVASSGKPVRGSAPPVAETVRDPLAVPETVLAARQRPMSERLELALSWNAVAAELRAGLAATTERQKHRNL